MLLVRQVGLGISSIAGTKQSTPQVPRDINPVWKHTMMFAQLGRQDVLRFTLRDTGLFSNEHLGGAFGPKQVATATLKVGTDFEGFLEMVPARGDVGEPVLKLVARFPKYEAGCPEVGVSGGAFPPVGTTAAVREALEQRQQQALRQEPEVPEPSAPPAEDTSEDFPVSAKEQAQAQAQAQAQPTAPEVGMSGGPEAAQAQPAAPGVGMSGGPDKAWAHWKGVQPTCSPFYIDQWVYELAAPNMILQKLLTMQTENTKGMFPVGGFRNYNCWGCGFQQLLGDWDRNHLWGPIAVNDIPKALPDVLERMELLFEDKGATGWCSDVGTLIRLLQIIKARC